MQNFRTDLALEAHALWKRSAAEETALSGVAAQESDVGEFHLHRVEILDQNGADALGKPVGRYVTVTLNTLPHRTDDAFAPAVNLIANELSALMPQGEGCVLVAGLGNPEITPDAIGSKTAEQILVTRHLIDAVPEHFSSFRAVSAIAPGVLGTTGVESGEIIRQVAQGISPDCILVVDALASHGEEHLCKTVQLTDTGIIPGSGVGNARAAITAESMGYPVVAIGIPTVTDGSAGLMVTPKEIDCFNREFARILAYAVNRTLQPALTLEELDSFLL